MLHILTEGLGYILAVPFTVKLIGTLVVIILFNYFTRNLLFSIIPGIVILALWSGHSPAAMLEISWLRLSSLDNLLLVSVIFQVISLSLQMEQSGVMKELVGLVQTHFSPKTALAAMPALIGLLPMPGGALFSAPMVDDLDRTQTIPPMCKTKINYWFRHFWEYILPLYPGVLLAIDLTGLPAWQFILLQLPMSLIFLLSGYLFILRPLKLQPVAGFRPVKARPAQLLVLLLPILLVIALDFLLRLLLPVLADISSYLPMVIGLAVSQIILMLLKPLPVSALRKIFCSFKTLELAAIVVLVRIYAAFIEARLPDGLYLMEHVREELFRTGIPLVFIVMFVTFLSGLTTGLAIGFVGASFPIVINLAGADPSLTRLLAFTVLAYAFGHIGMMISPVHVCHMVTNKYFKTSLNKSAWELVQPASLVLVAGIMAFTLLMQLG